MDAYEATRIVFSRIQAMDPENATKIMGLLLIQDHGDKEMIRLAFGPESLLHSLILKARQDLGLEEASGYWDQGFGWKPCLYFARGFCKNGSAFRFHHGPADDMSAAVERQCQQLVLMRSKSQRMTSSAAAVAAAAFPYSPTSGMADPVSRQIYLTFPADSTFREEDVSNYFSIYGPVQDVRIPYQQKRMFGFVTFVYPETVRLILAKGNPHFVCDARVLVKPYKEKGKVPDKYRQQPQAERIDFAGCITPTGLDSRDSYDFQQQLASARMMYNNQQDVIMRRKMEEAAELQHAIEMQGRRFMGLQLLNIKNPNMASKTGPILSPLAVTTPTEAVAVEDKSLMSPVTAAAAQQQTAVNSEERAPTEPNPNEDISYQESAEHNLPDSPFASPTNSAFAFSYEEPSLSSNGHLIDTMPSFKSSCFFQVPRFSSCHGAVGL